MARAIPADWILPALLVVPRRRSLRASDVSSVADGERQRVRLQMKKKKKRKKATTKGRVAC